MSQRDVPRLKVAAITDGTCERSGGKAVRRDQASVFRGGSSTSALRLSRLKHAALVCLASDVSALMQKKVQALGTEDQRTSVGRGKPDLLSAQAATAKP